ncbi:hypothetical protein EW146_g2477 [Bondarzewia mesenterica]|uniref:Uncharacterized protein n=1 Tax=Bondarzewia mesenterica TaxID=1095465 RepID=A0A4S4M211_9AGAM|nr:hypothetical protein EW146_g2477 [Bondarzewia mesenterica]
MPLCRVLQKLLDGQIQVTAEDLPTFLYEGENFDPDDPEKGLLHGELIVRIWRHMFQSLSANLKHNVGNKSTRIKARQAKLNDLVEVTPRTIAYAALMTHWALCSSDDWCIEDTEFMREDFFKIIVDLFTQNSDSEWHKLTLQWWNKLALESQLASNPHLAQPCPRPPFCLPFKPIDLSKIENEKIVNQKKRENPSNQAKRARTVPLKWKRKRGNEKGSKCSTRKNGKARECSVRMNGKNMMLFPVVITVVLNVHLP